MRITRGIRVVIGLAAIAGTSIATASVALADGSASTHVDNCSAAPYTIGQPCSFQFFDGNGNLTTYTASKWKDNTSSSGSETEVFIGNPSNAVPNNTGGVVVWSPASNPNGPSQTCLSFQTNHQTLNWSETIQPDGEWNLTCNFIK